MQVMRNNDIQFSLLLKLRLRNEPHEIEAKNLILNNLSLWEAQRKSQKWELHQKFTYPKT